MFDRIFELWDRYTDEHAVLGWLWFVGTFLTAGSVVGLLLLLVLYRWGVL
jgi:hypothetical protein